MFIMKRLLLILILTFSFQSLIKADDISDFQIEGMSIGDSLLNFFSKKKINDNLKNVNYPSDKYLLFEIYKVDHQLNQYDALMVHFKKDDKKYIVYSVSGVMEFADNIQGCSLKKKEIDLELLKLFKNLERKDYGFNISKSDKSGKSSFSEIEYKFPSKDEITIQCYDWSKKIGYMDHLRLSLKHKEFSNWIKNLTY
jgi:hypothetical protein